MPFLTEVECSRETMVGTIAFNIPELLKQRVLRPKESKYSGPKHFLPKQSPSPSEARANDFYVYKRMSRMLDSEFPEKIGRDPIDPLEGFRAVPKVAKLSASRTVPTMSPGSSKAKQLLQDARAWDFKYSEALEQSQFLKNRALKQEKRAIKPPEFAMELPQAISRSDIILNLRLLAEMPIESSEESDDDEYPTSPTRSLEKKSMLRNGGRFSQSVSTLSTLRRSSIAFGRSSQASTSNQQYLDNDDILLSNNEQKKAMWSGNLQDSRAIMQTDVSDPDSDETDKELGEMKKILESAKCRPFSDSRRCEHDEINPYGNSDFLNEYQDEYERSLSRLQDRKLEETAPRAKHMHVKREKFKSNQNAFFYSLKQEIDHPEATSNFEVKSHLNRPRQLEGNPGYEYQRYCEMHSVPIQKQIALKKDAKEIIFQNTTMAGLPQATAISHFLKNTADLRKVVIHSCSVRGLEFNVLSPTLGNLRMLSSITLIDADFSNEQYRVSSSFAQLTSLTELVIRNCKLSDAHCCELINAIKPITDLKTICLAQNLVGMRTCNAIAGVFCDPWTKWQQVDLSWNHVQGLCPMLMFGCLGRNYTVQSIDLSWNGMRHETSLVAFCDAVSNSECVKIVNLSNCEISDYGALLIADLLQKTKSLTRLNLLQNPICTLGCRSILRTLGLRQQRSPDLQGIRVLLPLEDRSVMESVFDTETLAGNLKLNLMLPSHRHILRTIFKRKGEGSAAVIGAMKYKGVSWQFEKLIEEVQKLELDFLHKLSDDVERVWNGAQEPEPEPEKSTETESLQPVLFIPGQNVENDEEQISEDDEIADLPTEDGNDEGSADDSSDVAVKTSNFIAEKSNSLLTFALMTHRSALPSGDTIVTLFELDYVVYLLESIDLTVPGNALRQYDAVRLLFSGSNVLKTVDVIKVLNHVCDDYKIPATKLALSRCIEQNGMEQILENLSKTEYVSLSIMVSGSIMKFTPNNPTGRYNLRLSEQLDRDFFLRLVDIKMAQDESLKSDSVWQSYRYNNIERNFLNTSLDGNPLTIDRSFVCPNNGNLSFDFVSHIPPDPDAFPVVTEKHILEFVIGAQDENEKLNLFRKWSNVNMFTVPQAIRVLTIFSGDDNRVEFCVIAFNRLVDWHGRLRLFQILSTSAMNMLISRIGYQNLWDDITAVQYHEYNLSIPAERFCVGRLVDLAVIEPGENMCYEHFNEREFQCPASWSNDDVPKKGMFSVYYCRSDRVIAGLMSRCPAQSIPANYLQFQPSGQDWVELHKRNRLRRMIRDKFPDPVRAFLVMDESGDGSLGRKEFARGLRILGIELKAHELANLMELLDDDGGGEIDAEEFVAFVNGTD